MVWCRETCNLIQKVWRDDLDPAAGLYTLYYTVTYYVVSAEISLPLNNLGKNQQCSYAAVSVSTYFI
jgi:hypothetical protein